LFQNYILKQKIKADNTLCAICLDFYFEKDSWISLLGSIQEKKISLTK